MHELSSIKITKQANQHIWKLVKTRNKISQQNKADDNCMYCTYISRWTFYKNLLRKNNNNIHVSYYTQGSCANSIWWVEDEHYTCTDSTLYMYVKGTNFKSSQWANVHVNMWKSIIGYHHASWNRIVRRPVGSKCHHEDCLELCLKIVLLQRKLALLPHLLVE